MSRIDRGGVAAFSRRSGRRRRRARSRGASPIRAGPSRIPFRKRPRTAPQGCRLTPRRSKGPRKSPTYLTGRQWWALLRVPRMAFNAVRQPRDRRADGEHAPAPIVVSVPLLENARHQTPRAAGPEIQIHCSPQTSGVGRPSGKSSSQNSLAAERVALGLSELFYLCCDADNTETGKRATLVRVSHRASRKSPTRN